MTPAYQRALTIVGLATALSACAGESPTTPAATPPAGDLETSLSASFDALAISGNTACSISISQHGQVVLEKGRGQTAPGVPGRRCPAARLPHIASRSPAAARRVYGAGGVTSTAADMNRFNQALLGNAFGFGAVESFDRSSAGVTSFGMGSGGAGGDLRFTHAGGLDTYTTFSIMFPADRSSVVVLCNFYNQPHDSLFYFVMGLRSIMLAAK